MRPVWCCVTSVQSGRAKRVLFITFFERKTPFWRRARVNILAWPYSRRAVDIPNELALEDLSNNVLHSSARDNYDIQK
jgi:hypothetical protein